MTMALSAFILTFGTAATAQAATLAVDTASANTLSVLTAQDRASAGLAKLSLASDLVAVAVQHSKDMAVQGTIFHNPDLAQQGGSWDVIEENVGVGSTPSAINTGFMQSPSHRRNILDGSVSQMAIGVVASSGTLYVTEIFRLPAGASPPAP